MLEARSYPATSTAPIMHSTYSRSPRRLDHETGGRLLHQPHVEPARPSRSSSRVRAVEAPEVDRLDRRARRRREARRRAWGWEKPNGLRTGRRLGSAHAAPESPRSIRRFDVALLGKADRGIGGAPGDGSGSPPSRLVLGGFAPHRLADLILDFEHRPAGPDGSLRDKAVDPAASTRSRRLA